MKPVIRSEILGLGEYEAIRERFRARVIDEKKRRRVTLGDRASAVFENHDTVLWQIQEMLRTERITREQAVLDEIATYNELIPGADELSATVMIEIGDHDTRERFLVEARGLHERVYLAVDGERVAATWDPARVHEDHLSAVLYLKFPLGEARAARIRAKTASLELGVDHPIYTVNVGLSKHVLDEIAEDLRPDA
jgi:hypothetical protein